MAKAKPSTEEIIDMVAGIRAQNNGLWMAILQIAMEAAPNATREVIKMINKNDAKVTEWLGKL